MKYVIVLADGMADYPLDSLDGRTPLEAAFTPNMNKLASEGICGLVKTVPDGMTPGSDTANLAVMGYDPLVSYTGRSPLEAVSLGIQMAEDDVALRCNLVTLSDTERYEDAVMNDYSSGEITTAEARELVKSLAKELNSDELTLYPGFSYRHCLIMKHAKIGTDLTPPHNISKRPIADYLPKGRYGELLLNVQKRSHEILKNHPINLDRISRGLNPATSCWFWGEGTKPRLESFLSLYGLRGAVISAVDLLKGIGICAGFETPEVEGATGTIDTNYEGKLSAAIDAMEHGCDFIYLHLEGPDECGHHGDAKGKTECIELIDRRIVGPVKAYLDRSGEPYSIMVLPDHPTPVSTMAHAMDPVPFALYRSGTSGGSGVSALNEKNAAATGLFFGSGTELMKKFLDK